MAELAALAAEHGLAVVEDAAHGLGGSFRGRPLGALGDAGCFSFHDTKNVTCGEGGALALRDPDLARRAEIVREKGTNRSAFLRGEVDKYTWVAEGSSYVLSDALAAILDAQLDKLDEIQRRRRAICRRYRDELSGWAAARGVTPKPELPERDDADHVFYLLYPDARARDAAIEALKARGVPAPFHYVPLHSSPFGRTLAGQPELPVTDSVAGRLLRLPLHPALEEPELATIVAAVRATLA
jgi:dTDP-4-amino-4,6-dideoxygalactose transaminase